MIISGWDMSWIHFLLLILFLGFQCDTSHQFFNLGSECSARKDHHRSLLGGIAGQGAGGRKSKPAWVKACTELLFVVRKRGVPREGYPGKRVCSASMQMQMQVSFWNGKGELNGASCFCVPTCSPWSPAGQLCSSPSYQLE